jgi:hypothetical protein
MLQVGDGIIAVDDEDVRQMTGSKASKYIAYKNHELLELTILRESQDSIDNEKAATRTDEQRPLREGGAPIHSCPGAVHVDGIDGPDTDYSLGYQSEPGKPSGREPPGSSPIQELHGPNSS